MITKTHQKYSLVEKELERIIASHTEKPISIFAGKELSLEPTKDLYLDIAKLAEALRRKGLEKIADELDNKAMMFICIELLMKMGKI